MEIKYVNYGVANRVGEVVEVNENLKKYPSLHRAILRHEISHTSKSGFTKDDFLVDFGESRVNNIELIKFMLKHPKSFYQFLPVYKKADIIYYDLNLIIFYSLISLVIVGGATLALVL